VIFENLYLTIKKVNMNSNLENCFWVG